MHVPVVVVAAVVELGEDDRSIGVAEEDGVLEGAVDDGGLARDDHEARQGAFLVGKRRGVVRMEGGRFSEPSI